MARVLKIASVLMGLLLLVLVMVVGKTRQGNPPFSIMVVHAGPGDEHGPNGHDLHADPLWMVVPEMERYWYAGGGFYHVRQLQTDRQDEWVYFLVDMFVAGKVTAENRLYRMRPDGKQLSAVTGELQWIPPIALENGERLTTTQTTQYGSLLGASPDGQWLFYKENNRALWRVNLDGSRHDLLVNQRLISSLLTFSPDGQWITYSNIASMADAQRWEKAYVMHLDGSSQAPVLPQFQNARVVGWVNYQKAWQPVVLVIIGAALSGVFAAVRGMSHLLNRPAFMRRPELSRHDKIN